MLVCHWVSLAASLVDVAAKRSGVFPCSFGKADMHAYHTVGSSSVEVGANHVRSVVGWRIRPSTLILGVLESLAPSSSPRICLVDVPSHVL